MKIDPQKLAFFRQSGWMVITTTLGGVFMFGAHPIAVKWLQSAGEYGGFATLLGFLNLMLIPSSALQTVFTQQTAAAQTDLARGQLAESARRLIKWTFALWAAIWIIGWLRAESLVTTYKITPSSLALTLLACLPMLWMPIFLGLLQGSQDFLWLGWATLLNGLGRFLCVLLFVAILHWYAAGAMAGAFIGFSTACLIALWKSREAWGTARAPINLKAWLRGVLPLTLGLGAAQFMFSCDIILVRKYFTETESGLYGSVGTIARGLVTFTGPIAAVMFPKIVRSAARAEKSSVFIQTLLVTGGMGMGAALFCSLFPKLFFQVLGKPEFFAVAPLVPWFTWCMTPLTVANVLVSNLMARAKFRAVPWLLLIAGGYWFALEAVITHRNSEASMASLTRVVQTLGLFNLLFLATALFFTWREKAFSSAAS